MIAFRTAFETRLLPVRSALPIQTGEFGRIAGVSAFATLPRLARPPVPPTVVSDAAIAIIEIFKKNKPVAPTGVTYHELAQFVAE